MTRYTVVRVGDQYRIQDERAYQWPQMGFLTLPYPAYSTRKAAEKIAAGLERTNEILSR